ncbi:hypothetical protein C9Z00_22700, partial [Escherichia coli]
GKTSIFSHPVYLFLREFSLQDFRGGSYCYFTRTCSKLYICAFLVVLACFGMSTFLPMARNAQFGDMLTKFRFTHCEENLDK